MNKDPDLIPHKLTQTVKWESEVGKNFVSDGHLCDRFCLAQPKIENL